MRIGVDDRLAIACDRDMAFPENQIAAFEFLRVARIEFAAEPLLLHVAVARAAGAGGGERNLHQPRTIDPEAALAAPQVGRADKASATATKSGTRWSIGLRCCRGRYQPSGVIANEPSSRSTVSEFPITKVSTGGSLIEGPGKAKVRKAVTLWVGWPAGFLSALIRQPADIAVAVELAPGPALAVAVIDRRALALERLRRAVPRRKTVRDEAAPARPRFRIPRR